jgi:hypothetical protein
MYSQCFFHIRKRELIGLLGKSSEKFIGEFDIWVTGEFVLPVNSVCSTLFLVWVGEITVALSENKVSGHNEQYI